MDTHFRSNGWHYIFAIVFSAYLYLFKNGSPGVAPEGGEDWLAD